MTGTRSITEAGDAASVLQDGNLSSFGAAQSQDGSRGGVLFSVYKSDRAQDGHLQFWVAADSDAVTR